MVLRSACKQAVVLVLWLCAAAASAQEQTPDLQKPGAPAQSARTMWEAATIYRAGDTDKALALLDSLPLIDQSKGIGEIDAQQRRILSGWPPRPDDLQITPALLRALAALEMEAARRAFAPGTEAWEKTGLAQTKLASAVFELLYLWTKDPDHSAARWMLAMGLEHAADGRFAVAYKILIPGCDDLAPYAPLLVACGSLLETYGSSSYDDGSPTLPREPGIHGILPSGADLLASSARTMSVARRRRNDVLARARKYLERAQSLDKLDPEVPIRLADVRHRQGDHDEAAALLEPIVAPSGRVFTLRERYLARMFLGRIREQQKRPDDALALYDQAIGVLPAQSALIARAFHAQQRGRAAEAADYAERAAASGKIEDPLWSYRFGQYWLVRDLYAALRSEARQ